jgi:chromosome partitioning protein
LSGKIISIANQKGGVGKTTTSVNLAACLAAANRRTLLIDLDPQGNSTSGLGIGKEGDLITTYQVLMGDVEAPQAIIPTDIENLFIMPANINLAGAEVELVGEIARELKLRKALKSLESLYDFILIDTPPSLGLLTVNGLACADSVIIPIQCEYYALEGLTDLLRTIERIRESLNPELELEGILMTMYDARTRLSDQIVAEVRKHFGGKVFQTVIPRNVRLSEAPSFGKPIITYDVLCRGAETYLTFTEEFLSR